MQVEHTSKRQGGRRCAASGCMLRLPSHPAAASGAAKAASQLCCYGGAKERLLCSCCPSCAPASVALLRLWLAALRSRKAQCLGLANCRMMTTREHWLILRRSKQGMRRLEARRCGCPPGGLGETGMHPTSRPVQEKDQRSRLPLPCCSSRPRLHGSGSSQGWQGGVKTARGKWELRSRPTAFWAGHWLHELCNQLHPNRGTCTASHSLLQCRPAPVLQAQEHARGGGAPVTPLATLTKM